VPGRNAKGEPAARGQAAPTFRWPPSRTSTMYHRLLGWRLFLEREKHAPALPNCRTRARERYHHRPCRAPPHTPPRIGFALCRCAARPGRAAPSAAQSRSSWVYALPCPLQRRRRPALVAPRQSLAAGLHLRSSLASASSSASSAPVASILPREKASIGRSFTTV